MLYEKETLAPCLLTNNNINNDDVDVKFHVINGAWGGTFTKGRVLINHLDHGSKWSSDEVKCYIYLIRMMISTIWITMMYLFISKSW